MRVVVMTAVNDTDFGNVDCVRKTDQLLYDMLVTFNSTRTPLYAAFVGYSNDNIVLAKIATDDTIHIRFRDSSTNGLRRTL